MHIQDIFAPAPRPRSASSSSRRRPTRRREELFRTIAPLQELQPSFVSVTYGAGGSTRERTHDLVVRIERETEPDGRLAPDLRLPLARRDDGDPRPLRRERASRTSWPSAATRRRTLAELRPRARTPSGTPSSWCSSSGRGRTRPDRARVRHRRRRLPRGPPRHARTGSRRWTT